MKLRIGFVSNSSSSSFLIIDKDVKTIGECAYYMLSLVKKEWEEQQWNDDNKIQSALNWLENNANYDKPIMFPWSINCETWIWKNKLGICVDTCSNHEWYDLFDKRSAGDDWKWDCRYGDQDPFKENWEESCYLNLSNMEEISVKDYKP